MPVFKGFDGPESVALWLSERAGRPISWEKVEPGPPADGVVIEGDVL